VKIAVKEFLTEAVYRSLDALYFYDIDTD